MLGGIRLICVSLASSGGIPRPIFHLLHLTSSSKSALHSRLQPPWQVPRTFVYRPPITTGTQFRVGYCKLSNKRLAMLNHLQLRCSLARAINTSSQSTRVSSARALASLKRSLTENGANPRTSWWSYPMMILTLLHST